MHYVWLFCIFTALGLALRGMDAVKWRPGMVESVRTNLATALANNLVSPVIFASLAGLGQQVLPKAGLPGISPQAWDGVPLALSMLAYIVMRDFSDYWLHRLLHTAPVWPVHAVHHSDTDMNWTSSYRIHLIEGVMMWLSTLLMVVLTGIPPIGALAGFLAFQVYNAFLHTEGDIHFGPLNRIFATPRFHQWHHAHEPSAYNTNFANIFSLWDVIFGTYRVPGPCTAKIGFEGTPGHDFIALLIWPFREWAGMLSRLRIGQVRRDPQIAAATS